MWCRRLVVLHCDMARHIPEWYKGCQCAKRNACGWSSEGAGYLRGKAQGLLSRLIRQRRYVPGLARHGTMRYKAWPTDMCMCPRYGGASPATRLALEYGTWLVRFNAIWVSFLMI